MKTARFLAALLFVSQAAVAADSVKLELGVHEAARAARKAKLETVLIVTRRDARSPRDLDTEQVLDALLEQASRMVNREQGLKSVSDEKITKSARRTGARRPIRPSQATTMLEGRKADAVLGIDFRDNRGKFSARLTLVDSVKTHFDSTVSLERRPTDSPEKTSSKGKESPGKKKGSSQKAGSSLPFEIPKEFRGSTGFTMKRDQLPGIARTRGGRGSRGIAVRGLGGEQERKTETRDGEGGKGEKEDGEREDEKSENSAPRTPLPNSRIARGIVGFATSNIGKQVGNGECWTLAAEAMKAAGAEPPKGYTFGDEIRLNQIQPGDILQFTSARFDEPGYWAIMGTPNHTAVVYTVGERTFILHQNVSGKKYVQSFDLDFDNLTSGRVQAFRPRPRTGR